MMARDGPHFFVETASHVYISIVIQYLMTSGPGFSKGCEHCVNITTCKSVFQKKTTS